MGNVLFLLLFLACPLLMWVMMRGGHGHGGQVREQGPSSIDDLRRRRDELEREIAARERSREDGGDAAVTET